MIMAVVLALVAALPSQGFGSSDFSGLGGASIVETATAVPDDARAAPGAGQCHCSQATLTAHRAAEDIFFVSTDAGYIALDAAVVILATVTPPTRPPRI